MALAPSLTATPNSQPSDAKQKFLRAYYASGIALVPALALAIPHGGVTRQPFPAVGLVPMGLGALFSLYRADQLRYKKACEYQIILPSDDGDDDEDNGHFSCIGKRFLYGFLDFIFALGILACLILTWIFGADSWYCRDLLPFLAAYATIPMMISCGIHFYLVYLVLPSCNERKNTVCPHCHGSLMEDPQMARQSVPHIVPQTPASA